MASKRQSYSIEFKLKVLQEVDKNRKKKDICEEFGIAKSTLSTFINYREKLQDLNDVAPTRKRARTALHSDVDEAVLIWFKQALAMNVPINGPLSKSKANALAEELGINDWEASDGWLQRFKHRHGMVFKNVCGESATVSSEMTEKWYQETLPLLLDRYEPSDIFDADETGLFYQCLPDKTSTFRGENASRAVKQSKQRLTLLVGANMDGTEKLEPLVIGKSANPRCFKSVRSLPVEYRSNAKAWMTAALWTEWLKGFDRKMQMAKRKVLLIIDN